MNSSNIKQKQHKKHLDKLSIRLVLVIAISGIVGISSIDLSHDNANAQNVQQKCTPDTGVNISKSNCFSNAPTMPVYNQTNTFNARPPADNNSTVVNSSN